MTTGEWILIVAVALALSFGVWRGVTDGRFRGTHRVRGAADGSQQPSPIVTSVLEGTPWAHDMGQRATLVQFSSAFCAPCRATRQILAAVSASEEGVVHLEIDAEQHLDVVRRLGIMRTPTTLILDSTGREVVRAVGAPRAEQVRSAIDTAVDPD